jgi:AcrR family transcriptional regulator
MPARPRKRAPLSRERVLAAALTLADAEGIDSLSMRRLGEALGVEAMSLYKHVANKDAILDALVDAVFAEIDLPPAVTAWRSGVRAWAMSKRVILLRHPWALALLESRTSPGAATLRQHDAVIGAFRAGGFTVADTGHAFACVDSYLYGFVLTELNLPFKTGEEAEKVATAILRDMPRGAFPHLTEFAVQHVLKPGYSYAGEFEFGLDLILDGLERRRVP